MPYPGRPSPPNGPGLYRTPAFIMLFAALFGTPSLRGFPYAPSPCCAESEMVRPRLPPVWLAHPMSRADKSPRARRTGFSYRVGASCPGSLRPFALLRSHATMPACPDLRTMGDATGGSPIPLQAAIKAHFLCEQNAHLQHIRRLSARYSALQFR